MNEQEHAIWRAAYAAAFVSEFNNPTYITATDYRSAVRSQPDTGKAWLIADCAVREFRKFQKEHRLGGPRP